MATATAAPENFYLDARLQEKALRDSKLSQAELDAFTKTLPDVANNIQEFDGDGNPVNPPMRQLKILPMKPGEIEPTNIAQPTDGDDPMVEGWE